jgi:glycerol kinase
MGLPTAMILAVDMGSTGIRAVLVDYEGKVVADEYQRIGQIFPRSGWIEHDLEDIWTQCLSVCRAVLASTGVNAADIKGLGITTQRNTLAIWERRSGKPLLPAISWSDNRTAGLCRTIGERDDSEIFLRRSGRRLTASNIGLKLRWVMDSDEKISKQLQSGEALWGTLDTWLLWKLTSGATWATDYANAATTGIFDLLSGSWCEELIRLIDLPNVAMPEVRPTIDDYGETGKDLFGDVIAVGCVTGDQYASLFGQGCVDAGMAKCTLGTGGFFIVNIGGSPVFNDKGIFTRICWHLGDRSVYGLEGAVLHVGSLLDWLCGKLGFVRDVEHSSTVAAGVTSGGVYIVPAFSGLASPYWDTQAKALIVGLSLDSGPSQLIRAGMEAVAFQLKDMVEAVASSISPKDLRLRFDGNVSMNNTLMQIVADQLQAPVERSGAFGHRSALGAAFMTGLRVGVWDGVDTIRTMCHSDRIFYPQKSPTEVSTLYQGWKDAVRRARGLSIH